MGAVITQEKRFFNSLNRQQKQELFAVFCQLELDTGGPDPHLDTACTNAMGRTGGRSLEDATWLVLCYIIPYSGAGGAALWGAFPTAKAALNITEEWVQASWGGIPSRDERKTIWNKQAFVTCVKGCAAFVRNGGLDGLLDAPDYETAWHIANRIPHFARYAVIKFLEAMRRHVSETIPAMPDIRPDGGWSPRRSLGELTGVDELKESDERINYFAGQYKMNLEQEIGREMTYFQFETLLCNLRQAITGRYPGRSHDSELKYWLKAQAFWLNDTWHRDWSFYENRTKMYDQRLLGEKNGWDAPRPACSETLLRYGYLWSDLLYDYKSTVDFARPVKWE